MARDLATESVFTLIPLPGRILTSWYFSVNAGCTEASVRLAAHTFTGAATVSMIVIRIASLLSAPALTA